MHIKYRKYLFVLFASLISGCATKGEWFESDRIKEGPKLGTNGRPAVLWHQCTARNSIFDIYSSAGSSCVTAFKQSSGEMIDMSRIREAIDAHLRTLPEFAKWPLESRGSASFYRPPYKFHLLTIDPIIVLATPFEASKYRGFCYGPMNRNACVNSKIVEDGFWFDVPPNATDVAFWFAPGHSKGMSEVRSNQLPKAITFSGFNAVLTVREGRWDLEIQK